MPREPDICPNCEAEVLTRITGIPFRCMKLPPVVRRNVSVGWQKVKGEPPFLGAGRCNSCNQDSESVLVISAGQMNLRLCPGCVDASGLKVKV